MYYYITFERNIERPVDRTAPVTLLLIEGGKKMAALTTTAPVHKGADREQRHMLRLSLLILAALVVVTSALLGCGGGVSTTDVQPSGTPEGTGTATLTWIAPSTNVDGTLLTTLAGYKVYYGTTPGVYTSVDIGDVNSYRIVGLTKGQTYYFTVTAYDTSGNESDYAPVASKLIS